MTPTEQFMEALVKLNEEYATKGVNTPTRATWLMKVALMHIDVFKIANTRGHQCSVLTEDEFLEMAKRAYWELRTSVQAPLAPELPESTSG